MKLETSELNLLLEVAASRHNKLCPRIVLGARIGLAGAKALDVTVPSASKQLMVFVETDGCFVSGVEAATGCSVSRRTMRIVDMGKVGATFINTCTGKGIRISPRNGIRQRALMYAPNEKRRYFAMLEGYKCMPEEELLVKESVVLSNSIDAIMSRAGVRATCDQCQEEIINERELIMNGVTLCQTCAGIVYYRPANQDYGFPDFVVSQIEIPHVGD